MKPTLTVMLPTFGSPLQGDWRLLPELARQAEDAGVDRVAISDHVVMGRNTDAYAWGKFPVPPEAPWLEPLTVLTAMATATSSIRVATDIVIAPLRPAALLAKTVATLDVLSGGRLDLGVGTGWQREEYDAEGLDFARRGQLLTDTVAACRALWESTPASFRSPTVSYTDIFCEPKPAQSRLPVWFSGVLHDRNERRIVELGDGWIPIMGATVDDIRRGVSRLREAFRRANRSAEDLHVQAPAVLARGDDGRPDLGATLASIPTLLEAGATDIALNLRAFCRDPADAPSTLQAMVDGLAAAVG
jgi:probable F420-dependent oxidoreductase